MKIYLGYYIAYGFKLRYKSLIFKRMCRKPIPQHPDLGPSLKGGRNKMLVGSRMGGNYPTLRL